MIEKLLLSFYKRINVLTYNFNLLKLFKKLY